ncbi:MAG TPA: DUF5610 domain-containing protein [Gammaproteobacteria bacterium]|nr:DUF5610 domain-containing protein [Gammaproteobacteria bacterium]
MLTTPLLDSRAFAGAPRLPASVQTGLPTPAGRTADETSPIQTPSAHALLDREVREALDRHLAETGAKKLGALDPADYTPEKVADRILGFIRNGVAQARAGGADEARLQQMLEQAEKGVQQGIDQARDILNGLGVLNGQVAEGVDRTEALLREGLDGMQQPPAAETSVSQMLESARYRESRRLALEITTADGDTVSIHVERDSGTSRTEYAARSADGFSRVATSERHESARLSYRVEGELDADEQKAVDRLLKRVDGIADRFYEGQTQAAFKQAVNLNVDSDELTGFSLSLRHSQSYQAVSAYRSVAGAGEDTGRAPGLDAGSANTLGRFLEDLQALLERPPMPQRLSGENDQRNVRELVDQRLAADPRADHGFAALRDLMDRLTERMVNGAAEADRPSSGETETA